jgi:hypothetical protein
MIESMSDPREGADPSNRLVDLPAQSPSAGPLWRNRDYVLLWGGQVVSAIGSRVSMVAFPLLLLYLTCSPGAGRSTFSTRVSGSPRLPPATDILEMRTRP